MAYANEVMKRESKLVPLYRKSFYDKARLIDDNGKEILRSYATDVAEYNKKTGKVKVNGWYSTTTARHINAFLSKHGKPTMSKAQMQERPLI